MRNCAVKDSGKKLQFYVVQEPEQYEFYFPDEELKQEWQNTISDTIQIVRLNDMLDAGIDESTKVFSVLKATYGILKDPTQIVDVTQIVQDVVKQQGSQQLILHAGTKANLFGNPSKTLLKKKKLLIVFSYKGNMHTKIFADTDAVHLPEQI